MKRALLLVIVVVVLVGSGFYLTAFENRNSAISTGATALIAIADTRDKAADVSSDVVILTSKFVLEPASKLVADMGPKDNRELWLAKGLTVTREGGPGSTVVRLRFHDNDPAVAKAVLTAIIRAYSEHLKNMFDQATEEKLQLLKNAVKLNSEKLMHNVNARNKSLNDIRKLTTDDPAAIQTRVAAATQSLQDHVAVAEGLKSQVALFDEVKSDAQKLASFMVVHSHPPEWASKAGMPEVVLGALEMKRAAADQAVKHAKAIVDSDLKTLNVVLPLKTQAESLRDYIAARTKLIDQYEAELTATELQRATGIRRLLILDPPAEE